MSQTLFQINANNLQATVLLAGVEVDLHHFHLPTQSDLPLVPELLFLTLCQIATRCHQQQIPQMRLLRRHQLVFHKYQPVRYRHRLLQPPPSLPYLVPQRLPHAI
jgi:hypothetical protein